MVKDHRDLREHSRGVTSPAYFYGGKNGAYGAQMGQFFEHVWVIMTIKKCLECPSGGHLNVYGSL